MAVGLVMTGLFSCAAFAQSYPQTAQTSPKPFDQDSNQSAKGHGTVSIDLQNTFVNGFLLDNNQEVPNGTLRSFSALFQAEYYFANDWSVLLGIPFVRNKFNTLPGGDGHCPAVTTPNCAGFPVLVHQHPKDQYLDDGRYHGTWQDWTVGLAWHTHVGDYQLTPSVLVSLPSHGYTFFQNAAVGQRIWRIEPSILVAHQFQFSNLYYQLYYGYALQPHTLGFNTNYHHFYGELGYFVSPRLALRGFATAKIGNGLKANVNGGLTASTDPSAPDLSDGGTSDAWYHHDQLAEHKYIGLGAGFDYQLNDHYSLSTSVQRLVWGHSIYNFKYVAELRLTRSF